VEITLKPEFEEMINERLANGGYPSAAAVVEESLRLLNDRDERIRRLDEIARRANRGLEQVQNGEGLLFDSAEDLLARVKSADRISLISSPAICCAPT
jgi:antitoxin ParD1/3/4